MTARTAFASVAGVVTVLLLLLSQTTSERFGRPHGDDHEHAASVTPAGPAVADESVVHERESSGESDVGDSGGSNEPDVVGPERPDALSDGVSPAGRAGSTDVRLSGGRERVGARELQGTPELTQSMLLVNVALSQGVFGAVLVLAAIAADVPRGALVVASTHLTPTFAFVGVALGVALYVADEVGASMADVAGFGRSEDLREFLAPESARGWVILLGSVLPVVAGFEELLFRGVLVGALSTAFGVSPWLLAVGSSVLFGLGHGAQGRLGIVVTTALGLVLAAAYVLTGSLVVVVVAHYLVNALEFVVHEGLGVDRLA